MTLQSSGAISLKQIRAEWLADQGGSPGYDLNYYRGGTAWDAAGNVYTIPSTNLDIKYFYGKQGVAPPPPGSGSGDGGAAGGGGGK